MGTYSRQSEQHTRHYNSIKTLNMRLHAVLYKYFFLIKMITESQILFLAESAVHVFWFGGQHWPLCLFEPLTRPSAAIFSGSSYSYSARNLNGLSRWEWGQQDEVMNRHSLTWSRHKLRIKISCSSIVSTLWASKITDWLDPCLPGST